MIYDLNFDDDDLRANREGRLTLHQKKHVDTILYVRQANERWTKIALLIFIPSLLGTLLLSGGQQTSGILSFLQAQLPLVCMFSGLLTVTAGGSAVINYAISGSARAYHISEAEGHAHIINVTNEWRKRYSRYELQLRRSGLNRSVFRFSTPDALRHFKGGHMYRVYYIEYYPAPVVLSAEEIG